VTVRMPGPRPLLHFESSLADQRLDAVVDLLKLVRADILSYHSDNGHSGTHCVLQQLSCCQYLAGRPIVRDRNFDYHDRFLSAVLGLRSPSWISPNTTKGLARKHHRQEEFFSSLCIPERLPLLLISPAGGSALHLPRGHQRGHHLGPCATLQPGRADRESGDTGDTLCTRSGRCSRPLLIARSTRDWKLPRMSKVAASVA
jgi:hypothetical protein